MRPTQLMLLAVLGPAAAFAQSPADVAYCNRLADVYERYIGRNEFSTGRSFGRSSLEGDVASNQCRQGNPEGIPTLERVLRNNGFSLPPRG
jgi:primosomal replication protein N